MENVYGRSKFVNQIFIYGDSLKSFLVAIVVPNEAQVFAWAKEANIDATDIATLCRHPAVKRRVFDDLMHCSQLKKVRAPQYTLYKYALSACDVSYKVLKLFGIYTWRVSLGLWRMDACLQRIVSTEYS